jgi:hypothetical protein
VLDGVLVVRDLKVQASRMGFGSDCISTQQFYRFVFQGFDIVSYSSIRNGQRKRVVGANGLFVLERPGSPQGFCTPL